MIGSEGRRPARRVEVWGVLNVTPDSFSDGGRFLDPDVAIAHAQRMLLEGADVIDVGGESTRPAGKTYGEGAESVSESEEIARVVPVVEGLVGLGARVSIDTTKAAVAAAAVRVGASIVNDVSGGASEALVRFVAETGVGLVLMHNRGRGEVDEANTRYGDVVADVLNELSAKRDHVVGLGVREAQIWLDPGLGFAKTASQSAALLAGTARVVALGAPVLVGPSRKSFLGALTPKLDGSVPPPGERLAGSVAAATIAALLGARAVRVHDVAETRQAVDLVASVLGFAESQG